MNHRLVIVWVSTSNVSRYQQARFLSVRFPPKHPSAVGILADKLGIVDGMELSHQRMTLADVDRISIDAMAIELQDGGRLSGFIDSSPSCGRNVFEGAVQQYALGVWIVLSLVVGQTAYLGILRKSLEVAVHEHVAVVLLRIANPHKGPVAGQRTMVEERRATSQYRVAATVDAAVLPITAAIGL